MQTRRGGPLRVLVASAELDSVTGPSTLATGRGLKDLGHEVVVASLSPAPIDRASLPAEVPIVAPEIAGESDVERAGAAWLRLIAARMKPDVIHAQGGIAAVAARAATGHGCPLVVSAPLRPGAADLRAGVLDACRGATALVAPTRDAAARLQMMTGADERRLQVIPPTADHHPWDAALRGNRTRPGRMVGALSDLVMEAAMEDFLHAAASIVAQRSDVTFVVLGDPRQRRRLEQVAAVLGIRERVGFVRDLGHARSVLGRLDVLCLPGGSDSTPFAAVHAMAAGTPIVAADVPELVETVGSGRDALLVPPADAEGLGAAVCQVLDRALLARRLTRAARRHWRHAHSVSRVAARYERLFLDCVEPQPAASPAAEALVAPASA